MIRSLWSGVAGIQAHQLAIDVEGNNIANVNTVGYKYSRANFSDLLSQNTKLATAPQGKRGGTNEMQIGLGSKINSTTRVFQQGSIRNTDRPTDIAIQGDGFLVLTADNGTTYKYTRNGDLTFDAAGNLVDSGGLKVQGWLKNLNPSSNDSDITSTAVDTTAPIANIIVEPGLRIPSKETNYIEMKANLNSGKKIINKTSLFPSDGSDGRVYSKDVDAIDISGDKIINEKSLDKFGQITNYNANAYAIGIDLGVVTNINGDVANLRSAKFKPTLLAVDPATGKNLVNDANKLLEETNRKGIDGQGVIVSILDREKQLEKDEKDKNIYYQFRYTGGDKTKGQPPVSRINPINGTIMQYNEEAPDYKTKPLSVLQGVDVLKKFDLGDGKIVKDVKVVYFRTDEEFRLLMQSALRDPGQRGPAIEVPDAVNGGIKRVYSLSPENLNTELGKVTVAEKDKKGVILDMEKFYTDRGFIKDAVSEDFDFKWQNNADLSMNGEGKLELMNHKSDSRPLEWRIQSLKDKNTTTNPLFTKLVNPIEGIVDAGTTVTSTGFKAPAHASSIHIFDSLGSRHSLRFEFTKISNDSWSWRASVPEPAVLAGGYLPDENVQRGGVVSFTENGALKGFTPPTITFTGNNGSQPNQVIQIDLGTLGDFDGVSQLDAPSSSQGVSQDGFSGGDLLGTRIDDVGTIVGTFSNGRSFALGQLALASFTNNSGLKSMGNNLFSESSNSGEPIIGVSGTGGKGGIQASSLELSNVDLSQSLTQLIALQRGFQANGKSITTSDDLLQTLIQLKN